MEKPCAINAAEAADVAARAAAAGVFAAVPYVIRYSPMVDTILSLNEPVQYAMFKFIGGMVDRYRQQRVEWVTDRAISGGGPLLNLGVHFMDMCGVLLRGADLTVTGAMMSNRQARLNRALACLRGGMGGAPRVGRDLGGVALEAYTEKKTVWTQFLSNCRPN